MKGVSTFPKGVGVEILSQFRQLRDLEVKDVSMLNLDVAKRLSDMQIPHSIEQKVSILDIDVLVKGIIPGKYEVCIDVHGYQHYFKNEEILLGNNILKAKLIKAMGYGYFEIPLDVWGLLDDEGKNKYLLEGIKKLRIASASQEEETKTQNKGSKRHN